MDWIDKNQLDRRNNISFKTKEISFKDRTEALLWIIGNQLNRRNLQTIDRIWLVNKQTELTASVYFKNREEYEKKVGRPQKSVQISAPISKVDNYKSREFIAKLAGVSHDTYKKGVEILKKASPKIVDILPVSFRGHQKEPCAKYLFLKILEKLLAKIV